MANFIWPSIKTTAGPVQFLQDGLPTTVSEDTATPANSTPLPVKVLDDNGLVPDFATATKQDEQTVVLNSIDAELVTANSSLSSIDSGIDAANITLTDISNATSSSAGYLSSIDTSTSNIDTSTAASLVELQAINASTASLDSKDYATETTLASLNSKDFATQTTLAALETKVPANLTVTATRLLVDGSGVTQPVSVASIPLPSGAATEATLASLNSKVTAVNTGAVVVSSSALPTGAATEATLAAQSAKLPATLGAKTSANSLAVVLASDQASLPVTLAANQSTNVAQISGTTASVNNGNADAGTLRVSIAADSSGTLKVGGKTRANAPTRRDYSSSPVTTSAYVTLVASLTSATTEIEIFDSSGQTLILATGAAASEVDQVFILPGGNGRIPLAVAAGTRLSIKAVSATASVGEISVNFYS